MGTFVTDPTSTLPGPKPARYWHDNDLDKLRGALLDLRDAGSGVVNVASYATPAAAIAAAAPGQIVQFPAGTYDVADLDIADKMNIHLRANGATLRLSAAGTLAITGLSPAGIRLINCAGVTLRGFKFDGNGKASNVVGLENCTECLIEELEAFSGGANGLIVSVGGQRNRYRKIKAHDADAGMGLLLGHYNSDATLELDATVELVECDDNAGDGMSIMGSGAKFARCRARRNGASGYIINGATGRATHDVEFNHCDAEGNTWHGFQADVVDPGTPANIPYNVTITGGSARRNGLAGVYNVNTRAWKVNGGFRAHDNGSAAHGGAGIYNSKAHGFEVDADVRNTDAEKWQGVGIDCVDDCTSFKISGHAQDNYEIGVRAVAPTGVIADGVVTNLIAKDNGERGIDIPGATGTTGMIVANCIVTGHSVHDIRNLAADTKGLASCIYGTANGVGFPPPGVSYHNVSQSGEFVMADATQIAAVALGAAEADANYRVLLTPADVAGAPADDSAVVIKVSDQTTVDFNVLLKAPPGMGTSRTFRYALVRP